MLVISFKLALSQGGDGLGLSYDPGGGCGFFRGANQGQLRILISLSVLVMKRYYFELFKYLQCLLGCTRRNTSVTEINPVLGSISGVS